jgi:hypothetical protein
MTGPAGRDELESLIDKAAAIVWLMGNANFDNLTDHTECQGYSHTMVNAALVVEETLERIRCLANDMGGASE